VISLIIQLLSEQVLVVLMPIVCLTSCWFLPKMPLYFCTVGILGAFDHNEYFQALHCLVPAGSVSRIAYADDVLLVSRTRSGLAKNLHVLTDVLGQVGFSVNASK